MITCLGRLRCVLSTDSRFLLRVLKSADAPGRLSSSCPFRTHASALFCSYPYAAQSTALSLHVSAIPKPISGSYILYETKRRLHSTNTRSDLSAPENDEKLKRDEEAVRREHKETKPTGLFAKLKYYLKRYWYIAIPIHIGNCAIWFVALYIAVKSGFDVVALLEKCHFPNYFVDKVKSVPANASVAVVAFLLYKIATPLRYASTILLIQLSFPILRRLGIMTAKEVKYRMRLKYTNKMRKMRRRYQQRFKRMGPPETKRHSSTGGTKKS